MIDGEESIAQLDEIDDKFKTLKSQPKHLKLNIYETDEDREDNTRVNLVIYSDGDVAISGNFHPKKSDELLSLVWDELLINDEEYPNFAKSFIIPRITKRIFEYLLIGVSLVLLAQIFYLSYAQRVGVDLKDSTILKNGNDYFNLVEDAIKSDSIAVKLDVLLLNELRGFTNVSVVIERTKFLITVLSISVVVILLAYLILILLRKRFPLVYYSLSELHRKRYTKIIKEREVIVISIIIAFVINIISGIILSLT